MRLALGLLLAVCAAAQQTGRIEGRVVSAAGEPLPGALVEIRAPSPLARKVQEATTTFGGRFLMEDVAPGTYELTVKLDGYYLETGGPRVSVLAQETAKAEIAMSRMGRLSGRVTGPDGEPVAGGILNPATGELVVGARGAGVKLNGRPAAVSTRPALAGAEVVASRSEVKRGRTTRNWE